MKAVRPLTAGSDGFHCPPGPAQPCCILPGLNAVYLELGGEDGGPLAGPALPEGHHTEGRLRNLPAERAGRSGLPGLMRPLLFISSSVFALHFTEPPISAQLLAFLRVFCMTEGKSSQGKKKC